MGRFGLRIAGLFFVGTVAVASEGLAAFTPPLAPMAPLLTHVFGANRSGRPTVKLDRLELPPEARSFERHLRQVLHREARRADWGVGSGHRIEYRFRLAELTLHGNGKVLEVRCAAVGQLPKGKTAKSRLVFGGDPRQKDALVRQVLEIVARGVITRLAEIERIRRGALRQSSVRAPSAEL